MNLYLTDFFIVGILYFKKFCWKFISFLKLFYELITFYRIN